MKASLQNYFDQWESPWMQLYYRMVWEQLSAEISLTDKKILDLVQDLVGMPIIWLTEIV